MAGRRSGGGRRIQVRCSACGRSLGELDLATNRLYGTRADEDEWNRQVAKVFPPRPLDGTVPLPDLPLNRLLHVVDGNRVKFECPKGHRPIVRCDRLLERAAAAARSGQRSLAVG